MASTVTVERLQELQTLGEGPAEVEFDDGVIEFVRDLIKPAAELAASGEEKYKAGDINRPKGGPTICDTITEAAMAGTAMFGIQLGLALAKLENEVDDVDKIDTESEDDSPTDSAHPGIVITPELISAAAEFKAAGGGPDVVFDPETVEFLADRFSIGAAVGIPGEDLAATAYQVGFRHGVMTGEEL